MPQARWQSSRSRCTSCPTSTSLRRLPRQALPTARPDVFLFKGKFSDLRRAGHDPSRKPPASSRRRALRPLTNMRNAFLRRFGLGLRQRFGQAGQHSCRGRRAHRIKLARELSAPRHRRRSTFLDEPTTGLHFHDVAKLLDVLTSSSTRATRSSSFRATMLEVHQGPPTVVPGTFGPRRRGRTGRRPSVAQGRVEAIAGRGAQPIPVSFLKEEVLDRRPGRRERGGGKKK